MIPAAKNTTQTRWILGIACWLGLWAFVFFDALKSAASVWSTNDTFNHCFLILPAAVYLIWKQRGALAAQNPARSFIGLVAVLAILAVYVLGRAAYIDVLQHLAVFELLPAMMLFLFGWQVVRKIWFPLLFISFNVPLGEELFPAFQNITADIAIILLKIFQVPVYRDGLYISIPNGQFVVAEACSGIRFFIACLVLGTAFAYINFISLKRSLLFVVISVVIPVIANGIRAFGIIYTGYVSDMKYAVGADHLIYGWFFFALNILLLIVIGHVLSDGHRQWNEKAVNTAPGWRRFSAKTTALLSITPFFLVLGFTLLQAQSERVPFGLADSSMAASTEEATLATNWAPRIVGADIYRMEAAGEKSAQIYQAVFHYNNQGRELISWQNRLFDIDRWSRRDTYYLNEENLGAITVLDLTSTSGHHRLLAYWYVVPGHVGSNPYKVKLWQAVNSLLLRPTGGALLAVSFDYQGAAETALQEIESIIQKDGARLSALSPEDIEPENIEP